MVYRYTALVAAAVIGFGLFMLNDLLRPTTDGPPWQTIVIAGLVLGTAITWTGLASRINSWILLGINIVAAIIVAFRVASPETTTFLLPTSASIDAVRIQLDQAIAIIRNGIEPVIPVSGLVVILTMLMWAVGALAAYGLLRLRPSLAIVPGLVLVLQFATMDRVPTSLLLIVGFIVLLAIALLAVAHDERNATVGRMSHESGTATHRGFAAPGAAIGLVVLVAGSVFAVSTFEKRVPIDGVVQWRAATGLTGDYYGGVSYNPFVSIQQSLVTQTDTRLFFARVNGEVDADHVYFKLLTMETYEGGQFFADRPEVDPIEADRWEDNGHAFAGPVASVTTDILIDRLQMDWLPSAYSPRAVGGNDAITNLVRVRPDDGSLRLDGGLSFPDLLYSVTSDIPQPELAVLAAGSNGDLSPLFAAAAAADEPVPAPVAITGQRATPPDAERYLQLPDDLEPGIVTLATERTQGLTTDFERGLALESWFRSEAFTYTTDIPAGHGATDLASWLLTDDSPFYRAGYCENFATSMAVMARTLGIHSRVVLGFTPGEATGQENVVVIRDRNAHAWVELWMPSQGWVRFDPTPRPDDVNPATTGDVAGELGFDPTAYLTEIPEPDINTLDGGPNQLFDPADIPEEQFDLNPDAFNQPAGGGGLTLPPWLGRVGLLGVGALLLLGGIPGIKRLRRSKRLRRLHDGDITAAWEEIVDRLTDYGQEPAGHLTPQELATSVDSSMEPLAEVYGASIYGPETAAPGAVATARTSLDSTTTRLEDRYSRMQRFAAAYRIRSVLPQRWRRPKR